jgi:SAM-dependent methyltransferase
MPADQVMSKIRYREKDTAARSSMPRPTQTDDWSEQRRNALGKTLQDLDDRPLRFPPRAVRRPLRRLRKRMLNFIFERGLETAGRQIEPEHFHSEWTHYGPSGWFYLRRALKKREIGPTDAFVDFGSGKGRVVFQAARYPFARVIGVEISERLNEVARRNIERNRDRLICQDVTLVTADAASFEVPDDVTVAYFYHPFGGATFERVIANIVASLDRRPRRLKLIYACPGQEDSIARTNRFRLVRRSRGGLGPVGLVGRLEREISIYESF